MDERNSEAFGHLDHEFQKLLCQIAKLEVAFEVISTEKANVDRLCMLSVSKGDWLGQLLEDHTEIAERPIANDAEGAVKGGMVHLSRLDVTIEPISNNNPEHFEP